MLSTYAELKAALKEDLARDDATDDLLSRFVYLSESQLSKRLRVMDMEATTTLTLVGGEVDLPADYSGYQFAKMSHGELKPVALRQALDLYPTDQAGVPDYFSVSGGKLKTYPPGSGDVTLGYYQRIPALSDENTSNWLLVKSPELYLAAALVQGFKHFDEKANMAMYSEWVGADLDALNEQDGSDRFAFIPTDVGAMP